MNDELLQYYQQELAYVRRDAQRFGEAHPTVAPRLRIDAEGSRDPYVERLIEAFAFLSARTRLRIDDALPAIGRGLMDVLAPHYQRPVPSMSIVQFRLPDSEAGVAQGRTVPRHATMDLEQGSRDVGRFRTTQEVRVLPVHVTGLQVTAGASAPEGTVGPDCPAALVLTLETLRCELPFSDLELDPFVLYVDGDASAANALFELLAGRLGDAVLQVDPTRGVRGDADRIRFEPVGFDDDESVLPHPRRSFRGFRILTEFFALPERFRFVALRGLDGAALATAGPVIRLVFPISRPPAILERLDDSDMLKPGCTPIVNLFECSCEPFRSKGTSAQERVIANPRNDDWEVYSVDAVSVASGGVERQIPPIYGTSSFSRSGAQLYWHADRVQVPGTGAGASAWREETELTFVDPEAVPASPSREDVTVNVTCVNRGLYESIRSGMGRTTLRLSDAGTLAPPTMLLEPTPLRRVPSGRHPDAARGIVWRLVSHLALGRLSMVEGPQGGDGAEELRSLLYLYDYAMTPAGRNRIDGIRAVSRRHRTARVGAMDQASVARGTETTIRFDPEKFSDNSLYLFATVLERVLALSCAVNSFSCIVVRTTEHGTEEPFATWIPRAGDQPLL